LRTGSSPWSVVDYRGRNALEQLESDWRRLYAAMPLRTCYESYDFYRAYLDHLMLTPEGFRCLALSDGRRIRAICPLEPREEIIGVTRRPVRVWGVPAHTHVPVSDVIGPEDDARQRCLPAMVAHLRRRPEGRSLLVLGYLPADSILWEGLPKRGSWGPSNRHADTFDCTHPLGSATAPPVPHFRRELERRGRKLAALGGVEFTHSTSPADVARDFEVFMDLEASGWKGQSGSATAIRLNPQLVAFYRALVRSLGSQGGGDRCEINSLSVGGRQIAAQLCMRTGRQYSVVKSGYDEAYAKFGPGNLLKADTLERCRQDDTVARLNFISSKPRMKVWHPDALPVRKAYLSIDRWKGDPLMLGLRLRSGPAGDTIRSLRRKLRPGPDRDEA
jgi:hypothetical protein